MRIPRARFTKRQYQRCDDACDSVLMENNGVAPNWVCNPFSSDSIVFNENGITNFIISVVAALTLTLGTNGPQLFLRTIASTESQHIGPCFNTLLNLILGNLLSQCLSGNWSKVLGLVWIDILTDNFRQHERLNI